jgi:hypothetical protein
MKKQTKPSTVLHGKRLRVIANAPFKGSVPVKELDAAIASVMAMRKPEVKAAVRVFEQPVVSYAKR